MRAIQLSQDRLAIVDDEDYPLLSEFRWCYRAERNGRQGYAVRHCKVDGKDRLCYLHRQILPAPPDHEVIFLNHDRLDCRRENLKVVTKKKPGSTIAFAAIPRLAQKASIATLTASATAPSSIGMAAAGL